MGNRFSTNQDEAEILVRDKQGNLVLYRDTMEKAKGCNPLPIPMEPNIQYLFLPSKGYHAHTYYDNECDTPANDVVFPETTMSGKNLNLIAHTSNSNSRFMEYNRDLPNKPDHPSFYHGPQGKGEARKTAKKAFDRCTQIPFPISPDQVVSFSQNNTPIAIYSDSECTNEYVVPLKENTDKGNDVNKNVDNRMLDNGLFDIHYTQIKSYLTPAQKSNPMYYRTYREYYPDEITKEARAARDKVRAEREAREAEARKAFEWEREQEAARSKEVQLSAEEVARQRAQAPASVREAFAREAQARESQAQASAMEAQAQASAREARAREARLREVQAERPRFRF